MLLIRRTVEASVERSYEDVLAVRVAVTVPTFASFSIHVSV
jgi:hypothetical protein